VIASVVAILFVLFLFRHTERRLWGTQIILGLILGGALGNLYDRVFCIADIASPGTELELRGRILEHNEDTGLYTIGSYPDGRERLGQAPGPIENQPVVRDFIKIDVRIFGLQLWRWVFNVADVALTVGILWLLAISLRRHRQSRPTDE
jgi:lipoprotein signal peptidase